MLRTGSSVLLLLVTLASLAGCIIHDPGYYPYSEPSYYEPYYPYYNGPYLYAPIWFGGYYHGGGHGGFGGHGGHR